jgi:hypothetical protein
MRAAKLLTGNVAQNTMLYVKRALSHIVSMCTVAHAHFCHLFFFILARCDPRNDSRQYRIVPATTTTTMPALTVQHPWRGQERQNSKATLNAKMIVTYT